MVETVNVPIENKTTVNAPANPVGGARPVVSTTPKVVTLKSIGLDNGGSGNAAKTDANYRSAAKAIQPGIEQLVDMFNSTARGIVEIVAEPILEDSVQTTRVVKNVGFNETSKEALSGGGSRIIAKRYPNAEFIDWTLVLGAIAQGCASTGLVLKELRDIKRLKEKELAAKKP